MWLNSNTLRRRQKMVKLDRESRVANAPDVPLQMLRRLGD
jgi:hypothetical protein